MLRTKELMKCYSCGCIFEQSEADYEDRGQWVPWQNGYAYESGGHLLCPCCRSDDVEDYYGEEDEEQE